MTGCPILRALCEGWDATALHPGPFPRTFVFPTLRKEREGWGTRSVVIAHRGSAKPLVNFQVSNHSPRPVAKIPVDSGATRDFFS